MGVGGCWVEVYLVGVFEVDFDLCVGVEVVDDVVVVIDLFVGCVVGDELCGDVFRVEEYDYC